MRVSYTQGFSHFKAYGDVLQKWADFCKKSLNMGPIFYEKIPFGVFLWQNWKKKYFFGEKSLNMGTYFGENYPWTYGSWTAGGTSPTNQKSEYPPQILHTKKILPRTNTHDLPKTKDLANKCDCLECSVCLQRPADKDLAQTDQPELDTLFHILADQLSFPSPRYILSKLNLILMRKHSQWCWYTSSNTL